MTRIIKVEPIGRDWRVHDNTFGEDMMFHSGAAAEAAARVIANASARSGHGAEVQILLRDGSVGVCLPYGPGGQAPAHRFMSVTAAPA